MIQARLRADGDTGIQLLTSDLLQRKRAARTDTDGVGDRPRIRLPLHVLQLRHFLCQC